ncbi:hypothetical protein D3C76_1176940 [compost metagenome]
MGASRKGKDKATLINSYPCNIVRHCELQVSGYGRTALEPMDGLRRQQRFSPDLSIYRNYR